MYGAAQGVDRVSAAAVLSARLPWEGSSIPKDRLQLILISCPNPDINPAVSSVTYLDHFQYICEELTTNWENETVTQWRLDLPASARSLTSCSGKNYCARLNFVYSNQI